MERRRRCMVLMSKSLSLFLHFVESEGACADEQYSPYRRYGSYRGAAEAAMDKAGMEEKAKMMEAEMGEQ